MSNTLVAYVRIPPEDSAAEAVAFSRRHPSIDRSAARGGPAAVTRAVNIEATIDHVIATSAKLKAVISVIEPLVPTGTRVVFVTADDAAAVARSYGSKVLTGAVTRNHWAQRSVS
jgi:hypothetical protein